MVRHAITLDEARHRRMEMVETAYREFRKKWYLAGPETWGGDGMPDPLHFFAHAHAQAGRVELKCDFPAWVLDDLELY